MAILVSLSVYLLLLLAITQPFKVTGLKYYQAKLFSLIFVAFLAFLLAYKMPYPKAFYLILLTFLGISAYSVYKYGIFFDRDVESVYLTVFAYFLLLRWFNPDIYGAEKFMDMAFINAVLHSKHFPPFDPLLSGYRITCYYYFGHVIGASITLMSFIPSYYGYNIAMAAVAAFASSTLYGFLKDLGLGKYSLHGVIFTLFTGDLYGFYALVRDAIMHKMPNYLYYWNATRVIKGTINEFPYFSFLHADFHAHVVAIPIFILFLSMVYSLYRQNKQNSNKIKAAFQVAFITILSAVVYLTNSWDSPILLLLLALTFLLSLRLDRKVVVAFAFALVFSVVSALLASTTIHSASAKILFVKNHSPLIQFLLYFTIPIAFAYMYVKEWKVIAFSVIISAILAFFVKVPILIVLLPLLIASTVKLIKNEYYEKYVTSLVLIGCLFTLAPEFVAVNCRMNTVFKFYDVTWILFCIAGSFALRDCFKALSFKSESVSGSVSVSEGKVDKIGRNLNAKKVLSVFMLFLFFSSFAYPVVATPEKCSVRRYTLNGLAFTKSFGEYNAIMWMMEKGYRGVILEAAYECYTYGGRFAVFTGNPTVVGWACHEVQWRGHAKMLSRRMTDVLLFYKYPNYYWKILKKYNVSYVILGYEERLEFHATPSKLEPLVESGVLKPIYKGYVTIYKVCK